MISKKTRNNLLVILLVLVFLIIYFFWVKKDMSDFAVCYQGGQRIMDGEILYRTADGHMQYKYSPVSAVFFSFFTLFPYETAKFLWYLLELILLFFVLSFSYDLLPSKQKPKGTVILFSFLILLKFSAREIELGQVNIFIIFLFVVLLQAVLKKNEIVGGLFWGFSLFFKPYGLVFFPYFILKKRMKLIAAGSITVILGFLSPVLFYGFKGSREVLKEWLQTLSISTPGLLDTYDNSSLLAFFLKITPPGKAELALIFTAAVLLVVGVVFLWMMLKARKAEVRDPEVLEFSFLLILIPLFSPLGWYYNYLYSFLAVILLLSLLGRFPRVLRYILIADFVIIGASLREVLGKEVFRFYTHYSLVAMNHLIILFCLFYSRLKRFT
ncbi:MAG: glycosyltransferase family 87 protein [Candidatus Aminicenantes bacterium]